MSCVEFQDLFPDRDLSLVDAADGADHLTVVTLSQRTQNDMTSWNDDVEQERENLLQSVRGHSHYTRMCIPRGHTGIHADSHVCCRQTADWIKMPLGTEAGLGPGDTVLDDTYR